MAVKPTTPGQQADAGASTNIAGLLAMAQQMGLLGAGDSTENKYKGLVWLGKPATKADPRKDPYEKGSANQGFRPSNAELALTLPYRWRDTKDPANRKRMERLMRAVSNATGQPVKDFDTALEVWQKAVEASSASWQATLGGTKGRPTTPWDELAKAGRDRQAGISNSLAGNMSKTTTHKSIQEVSDGEAWKQINDVVTSLMGRAAKDSEVREFAHRANQIAASNPSITTTTTDAYGNQTSKTTGGFSGADLEKAARKEAWDDPETGAFQAAGPLYNAFVDALSSMV